MDLEKNDFPETVGMKYEQAKAIILANNPELFVSKHDDGEEVTMDLHRNRVRVFVDAKDVYLKNLYFFVLFVCLFEITP